MNVSKLTLTNAVLVAGVVVTIAAEAQRNSDRERGRGGRNRLLEQADQNSPTPGVSPARRINRRPPRVADQTPPDDTFRRIDGSANNLGEPSMGSADSPLLRLLGPACSDGVESLAGQDLPGARLISNLVSAQPALIPNAAGASDFIWQWTST